ncbi:mechanosensitive ion channel [Desulforhopalus vacuolatus]|uniref:mechanosensitive ion channel family protein n=1 Tax=Desulforhopalus vacuolatus TaxID=40414 RepID=UPI0019637505|nr:mechanosensitive ion channel domain-containing protein [Desulforhopalus vacuolatus]MBM9519704.1 mechanosensitive ion channel [Desulforhopalus vacuolatus]
MQNLLDKINLKQFDVEILQQFGLLVLPWVWKVLAALLIFFIGRWISRKLSQIFTKMMEKQGVDVTLIGFLEGIIYYALLVSVVLAAASQIGVKTTSFFAILGAVSLAVGLALKDSLANFSAGVMLIFFRPFKVRDFIIVGGESGVVEHINVFNTVLNTADNQRKIIPNNNIIKATITNVTANPRRRVDMVIGIGYDDDIRLAKETLEEIIRADKRVLAEPALQIAVSELGASTVSIVVRPWVKTGDYGSVLFALTEKIKLTFDEKGISLR